MKAIERIINWFSNSFKSESYKDWKVVVLCIVAATTFWFFNALNKNDYNTVINYPIELTYENPNDSLVVTQAPPRNISVDVSGKGWILFRKTFWFGIEPIKISLPSPVDTKFLTAESLVPLAQQAFGELEVNSVVDDSIFFNIEKREMKKVRLSVDSLMLDLEEGYQLVSPINVNPDSILIYGPTSILEDLPLTLSVFIDEDQIDASFDQNLDPGVLGLEGVNFNINRIRVRFDVEEFSKEKIEIPIQYENLPDNVNEISDSLAVVEYWRATESSLSADSTSIVVMANYQTSIQADSSLRLDVTSLSSGIRIIDYQPRQVTLKYE